MKVVNLYILLHHCTPFERTYTNQKNFFQKRSTFLARRSTFLARRNDPKNQKSRIKSQKSRALDNRFIVCAKSCSKYLNLRPKSSAFDEWKTFRSRPPGVDRKRLEHTRKKRWFNLRKSAPLLRRGAHLTPFRCTKGLYLRSLEVFLDFLTESASNKIDKRASAAFAQMAPGQAICQWLQVGCSTNGGQNGRWFTFWNPVARSGEQQVNDFLQVTCYNLFLPTTERRQRKANETMLHKLCITLWIRLILKWTKFRSNFRLHFSSYKLEFQLVTRTARTIRTTWTVSNSKIFGRRSER